MSSSSLSGSRWNSKRREEGSPTSVLSFRRLNVAASAGAEEDATEEPTEDATEEPAPRNDEAPTTSRQTLFALLDSAWWVPLLLFLSFSPSSGRMRSLL